MKWFFKRKNENVDASKIIDDIIKKQKKIEKLSNEELLKLDDENAVVVNFKLRLNEKCNDGGNLSVLNDFEKVFYLVSAFEIGIKEGGFEYFFLEEKGNHFKETINALKEMKLDKILSIYEKVFKKFEDAPADYDLRNEYFEKKITDSFEEKILRADELFLELPSSYFEHIKYEYLKNNGEKFK